MRRRLVTLAGAALCALAIGAAPALATADSDHWVVVQSESVDLAPLDFSFQCGDNSYLIVAGTLDFVWKMNGSMTAEGIAIDAGHGIETWVLSGVQVLDQAGTSRRLVGSQRVNATWPAGADLMGNPGGPFRSFSDVLSIQVQGTGDGRSFELHQRQGGTFSVTESGSCAGLALHS